MRGRSGASGCMPFFLILVVVLGSWIIFQEQITLICSCFGFFMFLAFLEWLGGMGTAIKRKKN